MQLEGDRPAEQATLLDASECLVEQVGTRCQRPAELFFLSSEYLEDEVEILFDFRIGSSMTSEVTVASSGMISAWLPICQAWRTARLMRRRTT